MEKPILKPKPWTYADVLDEVRDQFYAPKSYTGPDNRQIACEQVAMWRRKFPVSLPHAVDSTALLTEAIIHDNTDIRTPEAVRLAYCGAISRFVTGLTDGQQDRSYKQSMYDVGKNIGLPNRFVELRHEIIHGGLPSLAELRMRAHEALNWLYHDYWIHHAQKLPQLDEAEAFSSSILKLLHQRRGMVYRALKYESSTKAAAMSKSSSDFICHNIVKYCHNDSSKLDLFVPALVSIGMLVPASKTPGSSMDEVFNVWDDILKAINNHQNNFLPLLTGEMTSALFAPTAPEVAHTRLQEAMAQWLQHVYCDKSWKKGRDRAHLKIQTLMAACLANPCFWTLHLALSVINHHTWRKVRSEYVEKILAAMEADGHSNAEVGDADAMDMAGGDGSEVAEASGVSMVENDEPAAYGLDTMATAIEQVEEEAEEGEDATDGPPMHSYTLCLRTVQNPWYSAPVGTFK
ncbi:rRNA-processing protein las1 [Xylographa bjoerkii]|nr:rRNA-processing protein las1 [Xylographa bjoerkii]